MININNILKDFKEKISNIENELLKTEKTFNKINTSVDEITLPKIKEIQKVFESLYNISKVVTRIKDNILEFIIFDTGNFKSAYGYLKQINSINSLGLDFQKVQIIIYSYAEHRAYNLYNEFIKAKEAKKKAQRTMQSFNLHTDNAFNKSDFYIAAQKIYDNTPNFEVETRINFCSCKLKSLFAVTNVFDLVTI